MTTLQRILALLGILLSSTAGMAADEPPTDAPVADALVIPPLVKLWKPQAVLNVERDKVAHIVNDEDVVFVQSTAGIVTAAQR